MCLRCRKYLVPPTVGVWSRCKPRFAILHFACCKVSKGLLCLESCKGEPEALSQDKANNILGVHVICTTSLRNVVCPLLDTTNRRKRRESHKISRQSSTASTSPVCESRSFSDSTSLRTSALEFLPLSFGTSRMTGRLTHTRIDFFAVLDYGTSLSQSRNFPDGDCSS